MNETLLISTNQKLACPDRVGRSGSIFFSLFPEWISRWRMCVLDRFKVENLKDMQRKGLEKLVNGEDVLVIQSTGSGKSLIYQFCADGFWRRHEDNFPIHCCCNLASDFANAIKWNSLNQQELLPSLSVKINRTTKKGRRTRRLPSRVWITGVLFKLRSVEKDVAEHGVRTEIVWASLL